MNTISHDGLELDTGFIVFNERNYPKLIRLFSELGVRSQPSEMSFAVGCDRCSLEWSGRRPFAQPLNAASPRFLAFLAEVSLVADGAARPRGRELRRRHAEGRFTKIASIEMLEAIGEKQFETYLAACDRLLAPGGRACIQTILVPDARYDRYRKTPDWIERYVFPGCLIPSLGALAQAMKATRVQLAGLEEIGPNYAQTLRRWRTRFDGRRAEVAALGYDERFRRTWDFYLAFCEAAFRTRSLHDAQLVLNRV